MDIVVWIDGRIKIMYVVKPVVCSLMFFNRRNNAEDSKTHKIDTVCS